jgi:hypothetical protein
VNIREFQMDIRLRQLCAHIDWRVKWRFGFAQYGCWRFLRIGKLGIQLWRVN